MSDSNDPYVDIPLSPRSRRLRIVGLLLLAFIFILIVYGWFWFQPAITRSVHKNAQIVHNLSYPPIVRDHARKVAITQITFAMEYWGFCFLLVFAVLFIAWLDILGTRIRALMARRALVRHITSQMASKHSSPEESK